MKFMQVIEYKTSKYDRVSDLVDDWLVHTMGRRALVQGTTGRNREEPDSYIDVIIFPSYEEAMRNNELPETKAMAEKMMALCEGGVTFRNLDVIREDR